MPVSKRCKSGAVAKAALKVAKLARSVKDVLRRWDAGMGRMSCYLLTQNAAAGLPRAPGFVRPMLSAHLRHEHAVQWSSAAGCVRGATGLSDVTPFARRALHWARHG